MLLFNLIFWVHIKVLCLFRICGEVGKWNCSYVRPRLCNSVLLGFGFLFHVGFLMMLVYPFYGSCSVVRWWL